MRIGLKWGSNSPVSYDLIFNDKDRIRSPRFF